MDIKEIRKLALRIVELTEPVPVTDLLRNAVEKSFKASKIWMPATEVHSIIEDYFQEPLAEGDNLRIGKIMAKLGFAKKVQKVEGVTKVGYYVSKISNSSTAD